MLSAFENKVIEIEHWTAFSQKTQSYQKAIGRQLSGVSDDIDAIPAADTPSSTFANSSNKPTD